MPNYLSPGVYIEEQEASTRPIEGVGTAVAAFVGLAQKGPLNEPTLVTNWSQFVEAFGDFMPGSYLAHSVYGYMLNGGSQCYIVRIGSGASTRSNGSASRAKSIAAPAVAQLAGFTVTALAAGGKPVTVEVADAGGENPPGDQYKLVVRVDGRATETYDNVSSNHGDTYVATRVNASSKVIQLEEVKGAAMNRPDNGHTDLVVPEPPPQAPPAEKIGAEDYVGDVADRTGFSGLEMVDEVTMVAVPDLVSALEQGAIDLEVFQSVQLAMIAHCELMGDRMAILDTPPGLNAQQVKDWRVTGAGYDSKFATLYWPHIKVFDPLTGTNVYVPPSGHMAGVWAQTDATRGVFKAPANVVVRGAVSIETKMTKGEHDLLNPVGINCIRAFPGRGVRVWGARTLSSDPAWRYLNVRRLFNYLEESIDLGTQFVVFEPNDPALWARICRTLNSFLAREWRKGALFGTTADEAFFVKCDSETNFAESIDAGQVVCQIGVAPVKPAEFVIFQLSQLPSGTSLIAE